jgi:hypothetical protein
MDIVCPVTRTFLSTVRNLYDLTLVQNELWVEPVNEWMERAEQGGGTRFLQHQRAFYCIELMLWRLMPTVAGTVYAVREHELREWPRSREGLNRVLQIANDRRDDLLAEVTEYFYLPNRPLGVEQILHENRHRSAELYKLICESCVILRQSLKNEDVTLTRVGKRLALAANVSRKHISDMLLMAGELLDQHEEMAQRAWERPT